jgi:ankyrin repeat protein
MAKAARAITFVQFVAIALLSLIMGGTGAACKRRDTEADDAARAKAFAGAVARLEADQEAKRAAADLRKEREKADRDARANALPPLLEAAQYGDAKEVKALLANGADRKTLNEALLLVSHSEPLVVGGSAAKDPSLPFAATAKLLLEKGANIEVRDQYYGATPLLLAARYGETAVVKLLLEKGAKIEAKDPSGGTALMAAACECPGIDLPDTSGSVRLLLESGADIEAEDKEGRTALMAAAGWGRGWIVKILLDKGARIEAKDNQGFTALLIAAQGQGYPTADAVQILLTRGADIEARNNKGESALMLAASGGGFEDVKIVKMLLNRGADARAQDLQRRTALDMAVAKGRSKTASLLRAALAKSR